MVEISRMQDAINRHGEHFLARIFTPAEREVCNGNVASLAARFAAKEAVSKALGCGIGPIGWTEIEILRLESGAPDLRLLGSALALSEQLGLRQWSLSLSHTRAYAIAMAVAND